jgi:hypothetical protein
VHIVPTPLTPGAVVATAIDPKGEVAALHLDEDSENVQAERVGPVNPDD